MLYPLTFLQALKGRVQIEKRVYIRPFQGLLCREYEHAGLSKPLIERFIEGQAAFYRQHFFQAL